MDALQGFDLNVTDYLVKPVSLERFVNACNKAKELFELKTQPKPTNGASFFFVNVDYSLIKIITADIVYIEGLKDYIKIYLKSSSKPVVTRMTMKAIEELLPVNKFIRIHKSYIIAMAFITSVKKTAVFVGPVELPVSETYQEALMKLTGKQG